MKMTENKKIKKRSDTDHCLYSLEDHMEDCQLC